LKKSRKEIAIDRFQKEKKILIFYLKKLLCAISKISNANSMSLQKLNRSLFFFILQTFFRLLDFYFATQKVMQQSAGCGEGLKLRTIFCGLVILLFILTCKSTAYCNQILAFPFYNTQN